MLKTIHRRRFLSAGVALAASAALPRAQACEFFSSTLRVFHPWTRATGPATEAVVCMKFDEVLQHDRLLAVESPVADGAVLIHAGAASERFDLSIPAGQETILSEDGTHVRLIGLQQPLMIARAYPMTLVFEKGGSLGVQLTVDFMRLS